nr:hypothetical protein [Arthrospira sp. SH-MAG29]
MIQLSQGLETGEVIFICFGSFPNRRGNCVLNPSVSVIFKQGKFQPPKTTTKTKPPLNPNLGKGRNHAAN